VMLELPSGVMDAWQKWGRVARDFSLTGLVVTWLHPRFLVERVALTEPTSAEAKAQLLKLLAFLTDPCACLRENVLGEIDGCRGGGLCLCSACLACMCRGREPALCTAAGGDTRMAEALKVAAAAQPSLRVSQLVQERGYVDASKEACELLFSLKELQCAGGGDWQRLQAVMYQPAWRSEAAAFSTLTSHCQLVLRMIGLEALELELRPNPYAKGSVAFVRPNASWLEGLLGDHRSVGVVLWGAATEAALDGARKGVPEILRRMRQLRTRDRMLAAELETLEADFFAASGDWNADVEPDLRSWTDWRATGELV